MLLRQQQLDALRQGIILAAFNTSFQDAPDLVIDTFAQKNIQLVAKYRPPPCKSLRSAYREAEISLLLDSKKPFKDQYHPRIHLQQRSKFTNIHPKIEHTSSDVFAHLGLSACGQGVALLSPILQTLRFPGVKFIPLLSDLPLYSQYQCAYLKKPSSPLLKELIRSIQFYRDQENPNTSGS